MTGTQMAKRLIQEASVSRNKPKEALSRSDIHPTTLAQEQKLELQRGEPSAPVICIINAKKTLRGRGHLMLGSCSQACTICNTHPPPYFFVRFRALSRGVDDGAACGTSVTAGAPSPLESRLRLTSALVEGGGWGSSGLAEDEAESTASGVADTPAPAVVVGLGFGAEIGGRRGEWRGEWHADVMLRGNVSPSRTRRGRRS